MKILNICYSDYANYSYANAMALRAAGYDAKALTLSVHSFGYDKQAQLTTQKDMLEQMREVDIIQIMHTCPISYDLVRKLDELNKHTVVYHTGTRFRQEPDKYNEMFNPTIDRGLTDQCEFMKLGIKNAAYVATAVDTDEIQPGKRPVAGSPLVLAHYPSKSQVKGTDKIKELLHPFSEKFNIKIDDRLVTHAKNLERIQDCDIYFELFAPHQNGREYGCYGVTAFEAAAMGKIVITQNLNKSVYDEAYGEQDVLFCAPMNEYLLGKELEFLSKTPHIESMQKLTRETLVKRHSYKASGQRIAMLLGL